MKSYRFEVSAHKCVIIKGVVDAEDDDDAYSAIQSGDFDTEDEDEIDCDLEMDSLHFLEVNGDAEDDEDDEDDEYDEDDEDDDEDWEEWA